MGKEVGAKEGYRETVQGARVTETEPTFKMKEGFLKRACPTSQIDRRYQPRVGEQTAGLA